MYELYGDAIGVDSTTHKNKLISLIKLYKEVKRGNIPTADNMLVNYPEIDATIFKNISIGLNGVRTRADAINDLLGLIVNEINTGIRGVYSSHFSSLFSEDVLWNITGMLDSITVDRYTRLPYIVPGTPMYSQGDRELEVRSVGKRTLNNIDSVTAVYKTMVDSISNTLNVEAINSELSTIALVVGNINYSISNGIDPLVWIDKELSTAPLPMSSKDSSLFSKDRYVIPSSVDGIVELSATTQEEGLETYIALYNETIAISNVAKARLGNVISILNNAKVAVPTDLLLTIVEKMLEEDVLANNVEMLDTLYNIAVTYNIILEVIYDYAVEPINAVEAANTLLRDINK